MSPFSSCQNALRKGFGWPIHALENALLDVNDKHVCFITDKHGQSIYGRNSLQLYIELQMVIGC